MGRLALFPFRPECDDCARFPAVKTLRLIAVLLALLALPAVAQAAPRISIFYYPWYGNPAQDGSWEHWVAPGSSTLDIASSYYPARGLYSSSSVPVVRAQMHEIAQAGVQEVVTSWWGLGSPEDLRLQLVIREAHAAGLAVAVHLEPYEGRTIATIENDIDHLSTLGITRFFVYQPFAGISASDWLDLRTRVTGVRLFAQTGLPGKAAAAGFDGIYTYDILSYGGDTFTRICSQAHRVGLLCLPSVGPGYDATHATANVRVKPRRDGATYDAMWWNAVQSSADAVTITSYNEWHEGTQIEPARPRPAGSAASVTFQTYDGAYGLTGKAAERAYLDRTTFWSQQFLLARQGRPLLAN
jgi:glycoprotein endo-alpha-1,2-mannosidase